MHTVAAEIFRQYDIRGVVGKDLTEHAAREIGRAYAAFLGGHNVKGAVAVGRDNRLSGESLRNALVDGLTSCGVDVVDLGIIPTPTSYWSLHNLPVVGSIQITGSHNPPEFNGFKMCVGKTTLHGEEIQELRKLIEAGRFPAGKGSVRSESVIDRYVDDLAARAGKLPRRLKVVYDCGNGVGAVAAPQIFSKLDVDATGLFIESDGTFPNHHPDPTVEKNLVDLIRSVKETGAEIGIGFDGDADRIGIVDGSGNVVWGDYLLIAYARDVLSRTGAGQKIIFDVKCSQALPDAIRAAGGEPIMWKTGHSLIKDKMKSERAPLAGEMSGHMFFEEGFYGHDDALYGAVRLIKILANSGKTIAELLADVPRFVSTPEIRVECPEEIKFQLVQRAVDHFRKTHDVIDIDGVRMLFGDGWGLIRASNTQPVLVMRFEASTKERLAAIRAEVETWLRSQGVSV